MEKFIYLKTELEKLHPDPFFVGWQCGLVQAGHRGAELHDDTCAIITSETYLNL